MKSKIIVLIALSVVYSTIMAQDIQRFLGIYDVHEVCTCTTIMPNYIDTINCEIEIIPSSVDTLDIQFYLLSHLEDTIRAKITDENSFQIPMQTYQLFPEYDDYHNNNLYSGGSGTLIQDSIEINYTSGSALGFFLCTCKGKKRNNAGLSDYKDKKMFDVYPNPASNSISIEVEKDYTDLTIEIIDETGRGVYSRNNLENPISLDNFVTGIYFVRLQIDGNVTTKKIVVE